jgi:hypothetical protein
VETIVGLLTKSGNPALFLVLASDKVLKWLVWTMNTELQQMALNTGLRANAFMVEQSACMEAYGHERRIPCSAYNTLEAARNALQRLREWRTCGA